MLNLSCRQSTEIHPFEYTYFILCFRPFGRYNWLIIIINDTTTVYLRDCITLMYLHKLHFKVKRDQKSYFVSKDSSGFR